MKKRSQKQILTGYRAEGIKLYRTPLKPLGYLVAGLGFACLGFALIPDALLLVVSPKMFIVGLVAYPFGFALLGMVGIRLNFKRKLLNKFECTRKYL